MCAAIAALPTASAQAAAWLPAGAPTEPLRWAAAAGLLALAWTAGARRARRRAAHAAATVSTDDATLLALMAASPAGMALTDAGGVVQHVNGPLTELLGLDADALIGLPLQHRIAPQGDDADGASTEALRAQLQALALGHAPALACTLQSRHRNGDSVSVQLLATAVPGDAASRLLCTLADLTPLRAIQQQAHAARQLNDTMAACAGFGVVTTDAHGLVTAVNLAGEAMLGWPQADLIGTPVARLHDAAELQAQATGLALPPQAGASEALLSTARQGAADRRDWTWLCSDGSRLPVQLTVTALRSADGAVEGFVLMGSDRSEQRRQHAQSEHLAHHDELTGLPNRSLVADRVAMAIERARRSGDRVGVMVLDMDHFKHVNDSLGHDVGDAALRIVAQRLRATVRQTDTVARMGGDEFVIVLSDITARSELETVASKIIAALCVQMEPAGHPLHMSPSIGAAMWPEDGDELSTLLQHADAAMYATKARGRNGYTVFTRGLGAESAGRLTLQAGMRLALSTQQFKLHYQPIVRLDGGGGAVGFEALLRWTDPATGPVSPAHFIPLAEESGLIVPLGDWVLRQACADLVKLRATGHPALSVAVNLSPRQFRQGNLLHKVQAALASSGLPPQALELEITEGVLMDDPQQARAVLEQLRALGVRIAIDDFGTGYSSLSYLSRFPLDKLKLDRSFVKHLHDQRENAAIATAVLQLGQSLGLDVVAEGVETVEQMRFLRDRGCAQAQGFLYSPALPMEAVGAWLTAHGQRELAAVGAPLTG